MPLYDYKNLDWKEGDCCDQQFEILHSYDDKLEKFDCPKCSRELNVCKIIGGISGIHFKGSGFYVNDYRKSDEGMKKYLPRDPNQKRVF